LTSKKLKWDAAYKDADFSNARIAHVLEAHDYLLPELTQLPVDALDLACGRAGNAQFLANKNFKVDAVDASSVLIEGLKSYVVENELTINCVLRDIENDGLPTKKYDVIVVSYFLNRELFPSIIGALKPGGLLFYQTWSQLSIDDSGPKNPAFRLKSAELLRLCSSLQTIYYREDGLQGDLGRGIRNEAMLIAKKT
jgi:SAM-dependent methyltransferase